MKRRTNQRTGYDPVQNGIQMDEQEYLEVQIANVLPCPFCGSRSILPEDSYQLNKCYVYCDDCGSEGPTKVKEMYDEYQNAFEAWNTRPNKTDLKTKIMKSVRHTNNFGDFVNVSKIEEAFNQAI